VVVIETKQVSTTFIDQQKREFTLLLEERYEEAEKMDTTVAKEQSWFGQKAMIYIL
jgi:hypothetical protein